MRRAGVIRFPYHKLATILGLPQGHKILRADTDPREHYAPGIYLIVEGPDMPECEPGEMCKEVDVLYEYTTTCKFCGISVRNE